MFRSLLLFVLLGLISPTTFAFDEVWLSAPWEGQGYTEPADVTVTSESEMYADGERVIDHRLYQNGRQIAYGGNRILSHTVTGLPAGAYQFYSVIQTNLGRTIQSVPHNISVVVVGGFPPTVTLAAPGGPYIAPATINLAANAADSDGSITKVEFYADGTWIGSDATAPYAFTWTGVPNGAYALTARAIDNNGIDTTSRPVGVTVGQTTVIGRVDDLRLDADGGQQLIGWACSTGRDASIDVQLYAGGPAGTGTLVGSYTANQPSEPAIASTCQAHGTAYRFVTPITAQIKQTYANQKLYVHGISPVGAANNLLDGSGVLTIAAPLSVSRKYVYDPHQQLCKIIEPEVGATVMDYDAAGNLAWSASGLSLPDPKQCNRAEALASGRVVQRTYDARNRLTTLSFPDGAGNQVWSYTPDGLPAQITTANTTGSAPVVNSYTYNKRRLLTGESLRHPDGTLRSIGYGYNSQGDLTSHTYPSGLVVDYATNGLGQPTKVGTTVGTFAIGLQYYPNGAVRQFTYGNGIVHTMTQNARQLPARSTDGNALDLAYAFDANANVSQILDYVQGTGFNRAMQYDGLDRLVTATSGMFGGDGVYRSTYDGVDNLRSARLAGVKDHTYWYDARNRLINVKDSAGATVVGLDYDVQGNLARKNGQAYVFDFGNRLRQAPGKEAYAYDGHGRRVLNSRPNGTRTVSQYSQTGQLLYQENTSKSVAIDHLYLAGSLVAVRERNLATNAIATKYQHTDALGSPVAVTNEAAQVVERTNYEPYGASIGNAVDGVGYTGHVMDAATGLTYMQQRYYDPGIGRFLSVDPVTADGNTGGNFNRYWYANNNPYKFTDPDGRATVYQYADKVVIVQTFKNNGIQFTDDQIKAQGASLSGQTSDGKTVVVQFVQGNDKDAVHLNPNPKLDDTSRDPALRSHADKFGGRNVEIAPNAAGEGTIGHELGHVLHAGDQYGGGIGADGKKATSDVPGPTNIMKNAAGTANTQTVNEVYKGASSKENTQVNCTKGAEAGC